MQQVETIGAQINGPKRQHFCLICKKTKTNFLIK